MAELELSERRFDHFYRNATDGMVIQDLKGRIEWANDAYCKMTGWSPEDIIGRNPLEFCMPPELAPSQDEIDAFTYNLDDLETGQLAVFENIRKNGERFWVQIAVTRSDEQDVRVRKVILVCRDVTKQVEQDKELRQAREREKRIARIDPLTGLLNRLHLVETVDQKLAREDIGILHVDLDYFKQINDQHGHQAGDIVLTVMAERMLDLVGEGTDFPAGEVCRIGGDEFIIITPSQNLDMMTALGKEIIACAAKPISWNGRLLSAGASVGAAFAARGTSTIDNLVARADFALYASKQAGRGQVAGYDEALHAEHKKNRRMMNDLKHAVRSEELTIDLQPIYGMASLNVEAYEALIRWCHPVFGAVSPETFLALANRAEGLAEEIDILSMKLALAALAELKKTRKPFGQEILMCINLSERSLFSRKYRDCLSDEVVRRRLDRSCVVLEINEKILIDGLDGSATDQIRSLADTGYQLVLDDFGIGQAGLSVISHLPFNGIKLDRSLVSGLAHDTREMAVLRAMISLCKDLDLERVVAEGVETEAELNKLRELGCPSVQGFYLGRPQSLSFHMSELRQELKSTSRAAGS